MKSPINGENAAAAGADELSQEVLQQRKSRLEVDKLACEVEKLAREIETTKLERDRLKREEKDYGSQRTGRVLGWLGGVMAWVIGLGSLTCSIQQFNVTQENALEQRKLEQQERAFAKIEEDPVRMILYLQTYQEEAKSVVVNLVHTRVDETDWPNRPLRALFTLEQAGAPLTDEEKDLLREQARRGLVLIRRWDGQEKPNPHLGTMYEILCRIYRLAEPTQLDEDWISWKQTRPRDPCLAWP